MDNQEHQRKAKEDTYNLLKIQQEMKSRFGNHISFMNQQKQELDKERRIQREKEQSAFNEFRHEQENDLARHLSEAKREEIRQLKLRQQLRENSHELRDLERKLKSAYVNKELAAQIALREAEKLNQKIQERRTHERLVQGVVKEEEYKKSLMEQDMIKKAKYKQELQEQMILAEESKRYLYEEYLREKKMIDDIIQRIHDEDERAIQERMCKMQKTREEMMAFKAAQMEWKERRKRELEEENRKIQEFLAQKTASSSARVEERKRREEAKARIQENLAKEIYLETMRKKEREDIIQELMIEEQKEALDKRHREETEKQIRMRLEVTESLTAQLRERDERLKQEAAEDAKYKEQVMQQLVEDRKLEQLSEQKRRMKMLQLRRDVEQMMDDRKQKRAEEMQLMIKLQEQEDKELEKRNKIIEEERISLLKKHVKNLVGYLPKGVLKPEDLPFLGDD